MSVVQRPTLGPLMSLTCFHYLRQGAEDSAGRALVLAAGRQRGYELAEELGLHGLASDPEQMRQRLDQALGRDGTRLCLVRNVKPTAGGGFEVRIAEGACTAGVTATEPYCAFTLGVFIGAISFVVGQRMIGRETECSAMGHPECVYVIEPIN